MSDRIDNVVNSHDVQMELQDLAGRDWQLWSIGLLVLVVVATGFVTLGLPGLIWHGDKVATIQPQFFPQLVSGLIVLIGLLNIYLVSQKRRLDKMRDGLIRNVIAKAAGENSPIMDRLTKVFGPDYVEPALEREVARADRNHSAITLALFDVAKTSVINRDHGILAGDYLLLVTAQLLKKTFRGADTVCRYGGDQFLVILPETTSVQAEHAFNRVRDAVALWNQNSELNYNLELHLGTATYVSGIPAETLVALAKTNLEADKQNLETKRLSRKPEIASVVTSSSRDAFPCVQPAAPNQLVH